MCIDDVLHAWCEAKETKEIVCSTVPVLYLPARGRKYEREKKRLSKAFNCLYSSLYYMTYLCAVRRSSYVVDTRRFDIRREAKERTKNEKQNKK